MQQYIQAVLILHSGRVRETEQGARDKRGDSDDQEVAAMGGVGAGGTLGDAGWKEKERKGRRGGGGLSRV